MPDRMGEGRPLSPAQGGLAQEKSQDLQAVLAPHGIGYRLKLLSQLATRKFQERLEPFGLTHFHWVVLCCLWQEDGLATSSISERLQQVGGTLTGVLDRMEERGLIRRERDSHDRRVWRIWLTKAGTRLQQVLPPIATELREQALHHISLESRQLLSLLLDRLIVNLYEEIGDTAAATHYRQLCRDWQEILAPHSLGYRIKLLSQLASRRFQERLEPLSLTPFHWVVLCCLWQEDGLATSCISDKLQQVGGTLTGVLDRMEERGLIRRERDSHDRRIWRIWLTKAGEELQTVLPPIAQTVQLHMLQDLSPSEQQRLSQLVDQVIGNLNPRERELQN